MIWAACVTRAIGYCPTHSVLAVEKYHTEVGDSFLE
jgi:hypothetical protein